MNASDDIPLKVVVVGDSKVGKTTLIHNYIKQTLGKLSESKIKLDYKIIQVKILEEQYCVAIWDSVGQEFQNQMLNFIVKDTDAVMLCIDLTKQINIQSIYSWMDYLVTCCPEHCQIAIIGIKQDLNQQNTESFNDFFQELQAKYQCLKHFIKVSFQNEESIKQAFQTTFELGAEAKKLRQSVQNFQSFILKKDGITSSILSNSSGRQSKKKKEDQCC